MTAASACEAVLLTGVYGAGKTSVAEETGEVFQDRALPYAALDLDWLSWFDVGWDDDEAEHAVLIENLGAVVTNYLGAGVRYLVLALSIEHAWELDGIRSVVPAPLHVVRVVADIETIERRLASAPTSGRSVDLALARTWIEDGTGEGLEDFVVMNDRPIREVALEVMDRLGW